jgi:putative transposase
VIVDYISQFKDQFGVEPICRVLAEHDCPIAPSTYYDNVTRRPSKRTLRDAEVLALIEAVRATRFGDRLGARKMWLRLRSEGHEVARCTVERLMATAGWLGTLRGKTVRTTISDPANGRATDLVDRDFTATRPNQLWVADFTYVATWAGMVYVAFIFDVYSRMIVGWRAASSMKTDLVLDTLEMAMWQRGREGISALDGLVHHTDAGSQGGLNRWSQHLSMMEVSDGATTTASRSGSAAGDAVTRPADPSQACGARVLATDRNGKEQRGGIGCGRRVLARRVALVSPRWRHAALEPGRAHRPLLVVPRA